ncbi:zinc finger and BTB domain-containing protein 34-like [Anguilla anguilla]|uniref:zinc finger and BTB domain-containing protein 34-like n=1 Tax=Anguilla anguilla TaxID=7936 RepID=UPI0015B028B1|nr:zinc finger and BTB domain-containing protein 34-like [Anguilla anguilla]
MDEAGGLVEFDVPEFSSGVLRQLNELRLQGKLCDIVVHIQGRPFRAHKAVLAASSPYFRDHSALGTMSGLSISVIKSPEVFERLLAFCYTGRMSLRLRDVVSFLTAASFLQMQDVIDRCTRILEGLHSKISLPPGAGPGRAGAAHGAGHNGVGEGGEEEDEEEEGDVLGDPSPAHFPREEVAGRGRGRRPAEEERRSDRGSSDGEAELEQVELIGRDGQVTDVRVKLEREGGDVDGGGDVGGYPMETADGEQVLAVSVGSSVLRPVVYPYPQPAPAHSPAGHARHGRPSPSRSLLGGYYGNRGRPKRASALAAGVGAGEGTGVAQKEGLENDVRVRSLRAQWGSPGDPYGPHGDRLVCVYCGKSFNQKGSLDRHMRLHMGITPFACIYCGKRYTRKDQLEYHIRGHTDNKPFSCHLCGKSFPFQGTLNQHLRKKHLTAAPSDSPEAPVHEPDDAPPPKPRPHLPYEPPPPTGSNNGKESPNASP